MIIDNIKSASQYVHLHPLFEKAFSYLKTINPATAETGKTLIDGDNLFIIVSDSSLKTPENAKLEAHNNYIDIQLPVSKSEFFGWKHRSVVTSETAPFNTEKDIQFYDEKPSTYFELTPGDFAIFFPNDAHAPCIGEGSVRKVVIKVKIA